MWRLSALIISLLPTVLLAQTVRPEASSTPINAAVHYLEDPTATMTLDEVRAADASGAFEPHQSADAVNFGLSSSAFWLRFTLAGEAMQPQRYLLEVGFYALTDVRLFHPDGRVMETGQHQPASARPWPHRHLVFPVKLTTAKEQTYYLRVASVGSITAPLTLWRPDAFAQHVQINYLWVATYYGAALALLVYNFLLYVSLRDRNYLLYCGFLFFTAASMFVMNGFGAYTLAPLNWPRTIGTNTFFSLAGVFAVCFLRGFLSTRQEMPQMDRALQILVGAFIFIAALPVVETPVRIGVGLLSTLGVITGPLVIAVTLISWRQGNQSARFLLAAWAVMLVAVSIQTARNFDLIPTNALTLNLLQIGSLLDMLLLSFALADRIQAERRAREHAQATALEAQAQLVSGLKDSERELEQKVQERTEALESALARERDTLNRYIEFGALIAHEFRNPLAIISNQTQLAELEQARSSKPSAARLRTIGRAAERLQHLFDQWLKSDRLKDNIDALNPQPINLAEWLPIMLDSGDLRVTHDVKLLRADRLTVLADEALLGTALHNLVDNAAKYSPANQAIEVETRTTAEWIGIAVTDHGPGVPPAERTRIFEKHHRAADNPSRRGLGLGLYFVAEVMKAHGGRVTLDSEPGRGSTFILWLPWQSVDTDQTT
ncbi:periplasmic/7TM domain sensor diguanylate cyclase [Spiribacter salinus M19-40]|jgi:signal transduction histidine kinase|uniref:histidine kinase n=1 Tax=Spiribacter salinus M19-40 TaxID=1260251 RepID=R4V8U2_9GAMM|nr:sensor histidine kinase [Spiribacter salinus]AGM41400.1 periplasmic/7TM domain sensor diguanylate cyclase [Spiribacter salinus M19-40]MBY5268990.1 hypothetical protein [Spiribacter salinus]